MSGLVYIASPYAGDVERNTEFAKAACRYAMECGQTPIAVHLLYPQFLRDSDPAEREAGLKMGHQILAVCDSLWLCGDRISEGMAREMDEAKRLGIPIREVSTQDIEGGISIEQQDLITEKLYSPLNFYLRDNDMLEEYDDVNYWRDELPHEEAWECMDQIELAIRRNRDTLNPVRGMMEYYHESESVNGKVQSLFPNIELRGDQLWCVADMKLTAPLTAEETAELKEWWCGQLSDGWGEGFEQREIKVARGELYIEPWTSEKSFFIATEREFCKRLGLELPVTAMEVSQEEQLMERLTANLADYHANLLTQSKEAIIDKAVEIAATNDTHFYLTEHHLFEEAEIAYLLHFQNPLAVVSDAWQARHDDISDIEYAIHEVCSKEDAPCDGKYALENTTATSVPPQDFGKKPSVLAQLRETKTAPTAVQPHKKSDPER